MHPTGEHKPDFRMNQESLFWLVYNLDKGLSLRFGRSSNIRDRDITLAFDPNALRRTRQAKIQGQVYDQLYSPEGLSRPEDERSKIAESLARELREIIQETCMDIQVCFLSLFEGVCFFTAWANDDMTERRTARSTD